MSNLPPCHLTTRDFCILEVMLERSVRRDAAFLRLLRQKLATATIVFQADVDSHVATINSSVDYSVDDGPIERRIIAHGSEDDFPGMNVLSISTLRGLALLGHKANDTILIEQSDGSREQLRIAGVAQLALDGKSGSRASSTNRSASEPRPQPSIVVFAAHRRPQPTIVEPLDPDDDPGPRAA